MGYLFMARESNTHYEKGKRYVGSEVLTAVVMKSSVSRDITSCSPVKIN
jgi:hypothetical protein